MFEACPFRYPREKKRYISYFHRRREKLKGETIQLTDVLGLRPPSIHYKPLSPSNIVVSRKLSWIWCPITTRDKRLTWILVTLYTFQTSWPALRLRMRSTTPGTDSLISPPTHRALRAKPNVQLYLLSLWPWRGWRRWWRRWRRGWSSPGWRGVSGAERRRKEWRWWRQSDAGNWRWPSLPLLRARHHNYCYTPRRWWRSDPSITARVVARTSAKTASYSDVSHTTSTGLVTNSSDVSLHFMFIKK